jgi:hypothetical protein
VPALLALLFGALVGAPAAAFETVPFARAGEPSAEKGLASLAEEYGAAEIADAGEAPDAIGSDDAPLPADAAAAVAAAFGPTDDSTAADSDRSRRSAPYRARAPPAG